MSMFSMTYNREAKEFDVHRIPDLCMEIIVSKLWDDPATHWLGELISDEEAEAIAEAAGPDMVCNVE